MNLHFKHKITYQKLKQCISQKEKYKYVCVAFCTFLHIKEAKLYKQVVIKTVDLCGLIAEVRVIFPQNRTVDR